MIARHGIIASGFKIAGGSAYDADAQAFFTAVEGGGDTLTTTQKSAVNQLVLDLKAASVWTKIKALYPIVGGTATAHKWNLKDPRDLDAAYRANFVGSPTHSANGIAWNGSSQYANTFLVPSAALTRFNTSISYYSRDNITGNNDIGYHSASTFTTELVMCIKYTNNNLYSDQYDQSNGRIVLANANSASGLYTANRLSSTDHKVFRNGVQIASKATAITSNLPASPLYIGGANAPAMTYSVRQCALAAIGDGRTGAEETSFYNAVNAYQTTLGRNV